MLEPYDALRSVGRYLAQCLEALPSPLPSDWEVRWTETHGEMRRPLALYGAANDLITSVDPHVGLTFTQVYVVHLYPERAADSEAAEATATALQLEVVRMFEVGRFDARPRRVPLLDHAGLDLSASADRDAWVDAGSHDYLVLDDVSFGRLPDPEDRETVAVTGSLRARWMRAM